MLGLFPVLIWLGRALLLVSLAPLLAACHPGRAVVLENDSAIAIYARVEGVERMATYPVAGGSRIGLGGNGLEGPGVDTVTILDEECRQLFFVDLRRQALSAGLIRVDANVNVEFIGREMAFEVIPPPIDDPCS